MQPKNPNLEEDTCNASLIIKENIWRAGKMGSAQWVDLSLP